MPNKITDNEFNKIVEQCKKNESCIGCPLEHLDYASECVNAIIGYCVDKINSQKAEVERLKVELIKYPTPEDWKLCKQCALVTVGKEIKTEPTSEWKHDILEARHSPIRVLNFVFRLEIPYWVSVHLCRHIHAQPFVKSQRNDRQSQYDRNSAPQNEMVTMLWYMNAEELMVVANKRLCNQASEETREVVRAMCDNVLEVCPEFKGLLVPMCEYGKCHEIYPCNKGGVGNGL